MEAAATTTIPEAILVEIIVRLPLRSIARFKSVCKQWKALIESSYLRRVFVSLQKQSSSSCSLMFGTDYPYPIAEAIGFHGCSTWDLPRSPGSYIMPFQRYPNLPTRSYFYRSSSNGLIWIDLFPTRTVGMTFYYKTFVGNPVSQQWVEIPPPPQECKATALVTRISVDEDGVVLSFKVVRTCDPDPDPYDQSLVPNDMGMYEWRVCVYSSETGAWSFKRLLSSVPVQYTAYYPPVNVNGMLYRWERIVDDSAPGSLLAYDFFGPEDHDHCQVIPLPLPYHEDVRRCLTTSGGDVIYIEILYGRLKVWKLNNNKNDSGSSEWWHLSGEEINLVSVVGSDFDCFPMAVNPFNADIIYMWSVQDSCLVSGNLRTQEFVVHQELESWRNSEGCYSINTYHSKGYIEDNHNITMVLMLSQFVLPQWMDPVPCLPN
ncbi:unnamed protein product [Brassica rapa]|uniref:F-box domain-containing protein n=1 Tax=Brassica campestris TaxID=3711 RepID=A0A3P5YTX7_BRACM|nr:unnamed protein product [Brassica rapa]VDC71232.1 unnamed protein product [Brassica rapa]